MNIKKMMKNLKNRKRNVIRIQRPRRTRSLRQDDPTAKVHKFAMETLPVLQSFCRSHLHTEDIAAKVEIKHRSRADVDNVLKGILDALQGIVYENDRQVRYAVVYDKDFSEELK